jgi:integrase
MDEMDKILWACDLYPDNGRYRKGTPARLKALVLLMRYSGLRIGDAVTLEVDRITEDRLFLYTQKAKVRSGARCQSEWRKRSTIAIQCAKNTGSGTEPPIREASPGTGSVGSRRCSRSRV